MSNKDKQNQTARIARVMMKDALEVPVKPAEDTSDVRVKRAEELLGRVYKRLNNASDDEIDRLLTEANKKWWGDVAPPDDVLTSSRDTLLQRLAYRHEVREGLRKNGIEVIAEGVSRFNSLAVDYLRGAVTDGSFFAVNPAFRGFGSGPNKNEGALEDLFLIDEFPVLPVLCESDDNTGEIRISLFVKHLLEKTGKDLRTQVFVGDMEVLTNPKNPRASGGYLNFRLSPHGEEIDTMEIITNEAGLSIRLLPPE